jgi:hypothetical protein
MNLDIIVTAEMEKKYASILVDITRFGIISYWSNVHLPYIPILGREGTQFVGFILTFSKSTPSICMYWVFSM